MTAKPSTRTTAHFAAAAGLAVTMLGMTACAAQSTAQSAGTTATPTTGSTAASASVSAAKTPVPAASITINASQLPDATTLQWKPDGSPVTKNTDGNDLPANECATIHGADTWTETGYTGTNKDEIIQVSYAFSSPAAAQAAYQQFVTGMQSCQQTSRTLQNTNKIPEDAVVTEPINQADADVWQRNWTGVEGMGAYGKQINHMYLVHSGRTMIYFQFAEYPGSAPYDTAGDAQVLATLQSEMG